MRSFLAVLALFGVASCGSGVTGEVGKACIAADRSAANPRLCSCVQQVANRTLGQSDQVLAATFFDDPQKAQDVRQSDNTSSEAFWRRYRTFSDTARRQCG